MRSSNLVRTCSWMYRCVLPKRRQLLLTAVTAVGTTVSIRYGQCAPHAWKGTLCTWCGTRMGSQCRSINACICGLVAEGQRPTMLHYSVHAEELILLTLAIQIKQCCSSLIWTAPDYRPATWLCCGRSTPQLSDISQWKETDPSNIIDVLLHGELNVEQNAKVTDDRWRLDGDIADW